MTSTTRTTIRAVWLAIGLPVSLIAANAAFADDINWRSPDAIYIDPGETVWDEMIAAGYTPAEVVRDVNRHGPLPDPFLPQWWTPDPATIAEKAEREATPPATTTAPTPDTVFQPSAGVGAATEAATAATPAPTVPIPETIPAEAPLPTVSTLPPYEDVVAWVNNLPYQHGDPGPAELAFRGVAAIQGWTPAEIEAWVPFARDVFIKEAQSCWNGYRGAVWTGNGCELQKQGRYEDAGFGQVIGLHYLPGNPLCEATGICSKAEIVESPFNSMLALVWLMRQYGNRPWCYIEADGTPTVHSCWLAPQ